MTGRILTEVTATADPAREDDLVAGFQELTRQAVPEGLLRTELLRGPDDVWRIQTLWRDRLALDAMRGGNEPPAAPSLFRRVGAEPVLTVLAVAGDHVPAQE
jgi:hypothetical protein